MKFTTKKSIRKQQNKFVYQNSIHSCFQVNLKQAVVTRMFVKSL